MHSQKKSSSPSSTLQSNGVVAVESTTERQAKTRPTKKFYQNTRRHHELPASNQLQEVIKSIREREREASYSHVADASGKEESFVTDRACERCPRTEPQSRWQWAVSGPFADGTRNSQLSSLDLLLASSLQNFQFWLSQRSGHCFSTMRSLFGR